MNNESTYVRENQRLKSIRDSYDKFLKNNPFAKTLPALHASDYDFYLKSVLAYNPLHKGDIYYKGRVVRKLGENK